MKYPALAAASVVAALALTFAAAGCGDASEEAVQRITSVTVTGTGSVESVPDRAEFSFGVATQGETADAALRANAAAMTEVIAALKRAGVATADLKTEYVSLEPQTSEDGETIVGYEASNSVSARVRDLGRAGTLIDVAVEAGANEISGPNLTRSDQTELYRSALEAAIEDAKTKAEAIAAASGVRLGRVLGVVEGGGAPPPETLDRLAAPLPATSPIEPGTQLIQAQVSVTFALR